MPLTNKTIAIPESRQLDVLARLLQKKNATVLRCPLVSIHDSPDEQVVLTWLKNFIENTPDDLVILTGEGIFRLTALAERYDLKAQWADALSRCRKIARGPKPGKALRELGLRADVLGSQPTTDGIIDTLDSFDLSNRVVAVQLYGDNPNQKLMDYLASRDIITNTVAPYVYASDSETQEVLDFIGAIQNKEVDMVCFTSQSQLKRLHSVARKNGTLTELKESLSDVAITAVGPTMTELLVEEGYPVSVQPQDNFYMGDMVKAIEQYYR